MTPSSATKIIVLFLVGLLLSTGPASGAMAQNGNLNVSVTQIDSQNFPQVAVYMAVSSQGGPALSGLTPNDLQLVEDGSKVATELISIETDTTQPLSLVMVLDVSMPQASLTIVQEGVNAFIDELGGQDQVAIMSLYDSVVLVQDFSNDKAQLKKAVNDLVPEGDRTALNEAIFQASNRVSALPPSRRGVVLFTNSADNISTRSTDEVLTQAQTLSVPIYFFGFGQRIEVDFIQNAADSTGGQAFVLSGAEQIAENLRPLALALRQGYKITFQSGLQADQAEHDLSIRVSSQGAQGEAQGRFTAVSNLVTVTLLNLTDGQTIGGQTTLTAQATGSAPIATVEYLLDDRTLATVQEPPYTFEWDATGTVSGLHLLSVRATDSVGNEGQTEIQLKVVQPIVVNASSSKESVEVGDKITVRAEVEALQEVTGVDFMLDGDLLQTDDKAPYSITFATTPYKAGKHTVTVQVRDKLGQTAETNLNIQLVTPPRPQTQSSSPSFLDSIRTIFARLLQGVRYLGFILLLLFLLAVIFFWQRRVSQAQFRLEVVNQGNVRSRYVLRGLDLSNKLQFRFFLEGNELPQRRVTEAVESAVTAEEKTYDYGDMDEVVTPERAEQAEDSGDLMQKVSSAGEVAGFIGEILYLIGSFLPRSMRMPVQRLSTSVRRGRTAARRVERASKRVERMKEGAGAAPSQTGGEAQPVTGQRPGVARTGQAADEVVQIWSQTPYIESGHTLTMNLHVKSTGLFQTRRLYPFKVFSKSIEIEEAPVVVEEATFGLKGFSTFGWIVGVLLSVIILAMICASCGLWVMNSGL